MNDAIQNDVKEYLGEKVSFDENYLLNLFMFNGRRLWKMVKDGPDLSDDTPYIEHPLVVWWLNPAMLDVERFYQLGKDDFREYLVTNEK